MGGHRSWAVPLAVLTTAVVVGAGAYAFGPARSGSPGAPAGTAGADASPGPTTTAHVDARAALSCAPGDHAAELATYLGAADGATGCAAVAAFQRRYGITPATGTADALTADVARRLAVSGTPGEQVRCAAGTGLTACVDLTMQTMWILRDGAVVFGPTVVRTGMAGGYQTPPGTYRVDQRATREWSHPYHVWLPYWQDFDAGIGFHETTTYLHNGSIGSHGCVNLLPADAVALWGTTATGTTVKVFGRRPGT